MKKILYLSNIFPAMQELYSLIKCLTSTEWNGLQNYLTCFSAHAPDKNKCLHLAQLLMSEERCPSENKCCIIIYGRKGDAAFEKLKWRLKEKTLDFLTTDICNKELDEVDFVFVQIKKKSAQFQQLNYSKPKNNIVYSLLDEIIFLAKKYEYYPALVEHLTQKKWKLSFKMSESEYNHISKEINQYEEFNKHLGKAVDYYFRLMFFYDLKGKSGKEKIISFLKKAIADVRESYSATKSPLINYYLHFLEMDFYFIHNNYLKARSYCLKLLNIVRENKSVKRKQRIGAVYDNLSRCELFLKRFSEAAEFAHLAQEYFPAHSENYSIACEQEFYAHFCNKKYTEAESCATAMLSNATRKESGEFRYAKYIFLNACVLFAQGKFHETAELLNQNLEISKDKAGWEIALRLLSIQTQVELLHFEEASLQVYSLERFIMRQQKKTNISKRDKLILTVLLKMERCGFMFTVLNGKTEQYLSQLSSGDKNYKWELLSPELIPFHEWLAEKMAGNRKIRKTKSDFYSSVTAPPL